MLRLEQGDVVAANGGVLVSKCMQLTSGAMYLVDELGSPTSRWEEVHQLKLDALDSLFSELGGRSLMVGIQYRHEAERILKKFERVAVFMNSDNVSRVKPEWVAGRIKMLVTHPRSCAHGVDKLQYGGNNVCYYSMPHSLEQFEQLYGRLARSGQKEPNVIVHALLMEGTVDYDAWRAVHAKQSIQETLKQRMAAGRS